MSFTPFVTLKNSDVKSIYSTARWALGTRGQTADGRVFRFALNGGTALAIGKPVTGPALYVLDKDTEYNTPVNDTEDIGTTWKSFTVETESATGEIAANEYAQGFARVAVSTASNAAGQIFVIKSNDASATSSTDSLGSTMTITISDDDQIAAALDTGAIITLHHNPYYGVVVSAGGASGTARAIVGIPACTVTASYYFWVQTWGPCTALQDGVVIEGYKGVVSSGSDAGLQTVSKGNATNSTDAQWVTAARPGIGYWLGSPGTDNGYGLFFLTVAP